MPVHARDAAQTEHAAREDRAGGSRGHEAVGLAFPHGEHAFDDAGILFLPDGHHGRVMVGDGLGGIKERESVRDVVTVLQQRLYGLLFACQDHRQFRVGPQGFESAGDRAFRGVVSAHQVQKDLSHDLPSVSTMGNHCIVAHGGQNGQRSARAEDETLT